MLPSFLLQLSCVNCNPGVRDGIWNSQFYPNLFIMLSAFIVIAIQVAILAYFSARRYRKSVAAASVPASPVPLTTAAMITGIGLGGFADGILLHQVLQWHSMLSAKIAATDYVGKSVNMFWDGIFHFFCLVVTLVGVVLLWKLLHRNDINRSGKLLAGGMLTGWGIFNITEGIIDHHLLNLHNVMEYATEHHTANFIFLGASVLLILIGWMLIRSGESNSKTKL